MTKLDMYSNDNRHKPKNSKDVVQHSIIRMLNRVWRNSPISDRGKKTDKAGKTNDYFLDIGKQMKNVIGQENIFYEDHSFNASVPLKVGHTAPMFVLSFFLHSILFAGSALDSFQCLRSLLIVSFHVFLGLPRSSTSTLSINFKFCDAVNTTNIPYNMPKPT